MRTTTASLFLLGAAAIVAAANDPFAGIQPLPAAPPHTPTAPRWSDNLQWRTELYSLAAVGYRDRRDTHDAYTRLSAGFEIQKRFSTATKTVAMVDLQGRLVYRNHPIDTAADAHATGSDTWTYETHNAYAELYHLLGSPGRFNLRAGYFYLPFGLSTQTDTHGTLLQLSNHRVFGAGHDWQLTAFGNATRLLDYQLGYTLGTGPNQSRHRQRGMAVARLALANTLLFEHGTEGGISAAIGERLDPSTGTSAPVRTWRIGADLRQRFDSLRGPLTLTGEGAAGEDDSRAVWSALAQLDWLHPARRWGAAAQYTYFTRNTAPARATDQRATAVLTRYFRNDVANSTLHWIALAIERAIETAHGATDTIAMLQYYHYW